MLGINPPLDSAATTGEAFGTLNARVWIDGEGFPALDGAVFEAGYQIGRGVDVSSGVDYDVASTVGLAPSVSSGVQGGVTAKQGVEGGPSVDVGV